MIQSIDKDLLNIKFICLQNRLGIKSFTKFFPGWKRSFAKGLEIGLNYEHVAHIENDVKILSYTNFLDKFLNGNKNYCGKVHDGQIESAFMVLNDKSKFKNLINYYSEQKNLYSCILCAEDQINNYLNPKIVFKGARSKVLLDGDYFAQAYGTKYYGLVLKQNC